MFDISLNTGTGFDIQLSVGVTTTTTTAAPTTTTTTTAAPSGNYSNFLTGLLYSYSMETGSILIDNLDVNNGASFNTETTGGFTGNSLYYNGTTSYSIVSASATFESVTGSITMMADIYPTDVGDSNTSVVSALARSNSGVHSYGIGYNSARRMRLRVLVNGTIYDFIPTEVLELNTWYRVIFRWESGVMRTVRINTVTESTTNQTGTITYDTVYKDFTIGGGIPEGTAQTGRWFPGRIDNVMGWGRALSDNEVETLISGSLSYSDFVATSNTAAFFLMF